MNWHLIQDVSINVIEGFKENSQSLCLTPHYASCIPFPLKTCTLLIVISERGRKEMRQTFVPWDLTENYAAACQLLPSVNWPFPQSPFLPSPPFPWQLPPSRTVLGILRKHKELRRPCILFFLPFGAWSLIGEKQIDTHEPPKLANY